MEIYIKYSFIGVTIAATTIYMFAYGPKPSLDKSISRKEMLEDRHHFEENKTSALTHLKKCHETSQQNYEDYWARACKSVYNKTIENCVNNSVPIATCNAKFTYSPNCELPSNRAEAAAQFLDTQKIECQLIYKYETNF